MKEYRARLAAIEFSLKSQRKRLERLLSEAGLPMAA
jgi:hypothetical protein